MRGWLRGSRLSERWQGRIVQACVESILLYDCQASVIQEGCEQVAEMDGQML